jgi:hypothetical protein
MQNFKHLSSARPNPPTETVENQSYYAIGCVSAVTVCLSGAHEGK